MKMLNSKSIGAMLICGLAGSMLVTTAYAQQQIPPATVVVPAGTPELSTDKSLDVEHDKVQTSAEHHYNSPAERANDDLLITEVKSSLADQGISDGYPVEVDCDHGTIQLSGVVASADEAKAAEALALNTRGVVGVQNKLTWR
jgi:BON domain